MNPRVVSVRADDNYCLHIEFSNNEKGIYSCRHLLDFGVFKELQDLSYFKKVRVEGGTVAWPHEQDICPDTIYLESQKQGNSKPPASTS